MGMLAVELREQVRAMSAKEASRLTQETGLFGPQVKTSMKDKPAFKGAHPSKWKSSKQRSLLEFLQKHDASPQLDRQIAAAVVKMPGHPSVLTTKTNLNILRKVGWARTDGKAGTLLTEFGRTQVDKILGKSKKT